MKLTAAESVAEVICVVCTGETARLIGTHSVHVTASVVGLTLIHIFKTHTLYLFNWKTGATDKAIYSELITVKR